MSKKIYVGCICGSNKYERFFSEEQPTSEKYGEKYFAVIGPFRTARGANYMVKYGAGNPHINHVGDAEKLAKIEAMKNKEKK